jgi:TRAP-type mannitol/chloroaromatic compound transport system substrate-binding protein
MSATPREERRTVTERRRFILKAGGALAAAGAAAVVEAPSVIAQKLAAEVVREESEKTPLARKVYASFTKAQAQLGGWARISAGAYHQFVAL